MTRTARPILALLLLAILTPLPALAGSSACLAFDNAAEFEAYCLAQGKLRKGIETFEESNIEDGAKQPLPAPFEGGTPNMFPPDDPSGIGFPDGLLAENLAIWDNITPGPSPPALNPSGESAALYVLGAGFLGTNSKKVGEDLEVLGLYEDASFDLVFPPGDNKTAVGFTLSRFDQYPMGGWTITTYDESGAITGVFDVPAPAGGEPDKTFFGVWCDEAIARINVWDSATAPSPDAIDNIQMWRSGAVPVEERSWGSVKATYGD